MRPADMFSEVILTDYPLTVRTLDSRLRSVFELHALSWTGPTFERLRKVIEMFFGKRSSFESVRSLCVSLSRLGSSGERLRDLSTSFLTVSIAGSGDSGCSSNSILSRGKSTRILLATNAKSIEGSEHLDSKIALDHLSKQPMTDEVFAGSKGNKIGSVIAAAKALRNDVMEFCVSFRKVGSTILNDLIVPAMVFVGKKGVHMFIYQSTCMKRV